MIEEKVSKNKQLLEPLVDNYHMPSARKPLPPTALIKLDPKAVELLQKTAVDLLAGNFCTADEARRADEAGLTCLQLSEFKQRMHEVLQDGKVTPFEAPVLFSALEKSHSDTNGFLHPENLNMVELSKASDALRHAGATLFASGPIREEGLKSYLQAGVDALSEKIAILEDMHAYLWKKEQSYWHFVSAENMLGLSYLFYGQTGSSFEVEGIERTLEILMALRRDVQNVQRQVRENNLDPESASFQRLWNHPIGEFMILDWWCGNHPINGDPDSTRARKGYVSFAVWTAEVAYHNLATRGAVIFRKGLENSLIELSAEIGAPESTTLLAMLPQFDGSVMEFLDNGFTKFANSVASLDSLALMASGSLLAKLVVSTSTGAAAVGATLKALGPARHILPGTGVLGTNGLAQGSAAWGIAAINVGFEFAKASAYVESTRYLLGDEAADCVGKAYMFLGSFVGTAGNEMEAWYARAIANKSPEIDEMLLSGVSPQKLAGIAAPHMNEKSLRPTRGMEPAELAKKLERRTKKLRQRAKEAAERDAKVAHEKTLAEKAAEHQAQIQAALQELEALRGVHPEIITEKIFQRARNLSDAALPAHKRLQNLRNLIDGLRGQIIGAERKAANSLPPPAVGSNGNGGSVRKVEPRGVRKGNYEAEQARRSIDETPPPEETSPFEPEEITPTENVPNKVTVPDELNSASISALSKGKVTVAGKVEKIWRSHFERYPAHKETVLRKINNLSNGGKNWKVYQGSDGKIIETRVGDFRIFARKSQDTYDIFLFVHRSDLPNVSTLL